MRIILCTDCGSRRAPTPHEDADRGLFPRYVSGTLLGSCLCDQCNKDLPKGERAVAVTIPKELGSWEGTYMDLETQP